MPDNSALHGPAASQARESGSAHAYLWALPETRGPGEGGFRAGDLLPYLVGSSIPERGAVGAD